MPTASIIEGTSLRILRSDFPNPLVDVPIASPGGEPARGMFPPPVQ